MKKANFEVSLPIIILREGDAFVAYTPALDLSTAGDSLAEVKERFIEAVNVFLEEAHKMGTLEDVLTEMGWKREDNDWVPPVIISHDSQTFRVPFYS